MLRRNVAQLITEWDLEDPNPGAVHRGARRHGAPGARRRGPMEEDRLDCEPALVLQIALETDCGGPRVYAALDALRRERAASPRRSALLRDAPPASATPRPNALWRHVATPARLRLELSAPRLDFSHDREPGEPPRCRSQSSRCSTCSSRPATAPPAPGPFGCWRRSARRWRRPRRPGSRTRPGSCSGTCWSCSACCSVWPPDFSAVTYARHPELRLRREAYKLLLEFPEHRASAIMHGLERRAVPRSSRSSCAPRWTAVRPRRSARSSGSLADWRRPAELRALAVRALARRERAPGTGPAARPRRRPGAISSAGASRPSRRWCWPPVSALARHWGGHPQVVGLLKAARDHDDPEIRLAARMRFA